MTPLVLQIRFLGHSLGLTTTGLFLALAGGVGATVIALVARRARVGTREALGLCFWAAAAGILAARVGGLLAGGGATHGLPLALNAALGLLAAALAAGVYARARGLDPWLGVDGLACGLAAAHAIVALGCLAAGCCYGRIARAEGPLTLRFGQHTVAWHDLAAHGVVPLGARLTPPLYAVQPIEAAAMALVALALVAFARRPRGGRVLGAYLLASAAVWAALAPWRVEAWSGALAVTCLAAGGIALTLREHASKHLARAGSDAGRV